MKMTRTILARTEDADAVLYHMQSDLLSQNNQLDTRLSLAPLEQEELHKLIARAEAIILVR